MAFISVRMTEMKRRCFSKVLFVTAWVSTLLGCMLLTGGLYIKIHIEGKMNLIEGYDSNILLIALFLVGGLLIIVDLIGGKLIHNAGDVSRRKSLGPILMLFLVFLLVLNLLLFSAGSMCFIHQIHLRNSFHNGLLSAMSKYSENDTVKVEMDNLQIEFACCGNDGYDDWFKIQWINSMYLNLGDERVRSKMTDGHYLNDDVPFSCCNPQIHRPCIHHHVHDNNVHYNYDHRNSITLYSQGCKQSLMNYFSKRLQLLGGLVYIAFFTQMFILLGLRILHTSMTEAEELGDPEATTIGYIFRSSNTSSHKDFKDVERVIDDDSDFVDDSTFDDEDFEEEIDNTRGRSDPIYENTSHMQGGQPHPHDGQQDNLPGDTDLTMDALLDHMPEGNKGSPSKKSTKTSDGRSATGKTTSTKSSLKSSKKKNPIRSLKKGISKRSPSKLKSKSKGSKKR